jgi:hypothetical protein
MVLDIVPLVTVGGCTLIMQIRTFVKFGDVSVGGVEWLGVASAEILG